MDPGSRAPTSSTAETKATFKHGADLSGVLDHVAKWAAPHAFNIQKVELQAVSEAIPLFGTSRIAHQHILTVETDSAIFTERLAVKTPFPKHNDYRISTQMAAEEIRLTDTHCQHPFFRSHFSQTLASVS